MNIWGTSMRHRAPGTMVALPHSVEGRRQRSNSTPDEDDLNLTLLLNETALHTSSHQSNNSNSSVNNSSRQFQFDLNRHPYTISLDQSKELKHIETLSGKEYHTPSRNHLAREQLARDHLSRDPLKEIKDNSRETARQLKQEVPSHESATTRKSRIDLSNWVKSKFNSDDLSLPNVPGGKSMQLLLLNMTQSYFMSTGI